MVWMNGSWDTLTSGCCENARTSVVEQDLVSGTSHKFISGLVVENSRHHIIIDLGFSDLSVCWDIPSIERRVVLSRGNCERENVTPSSGCCVCHGRWFFSPTQYMIFETSNDGVEEVNRPVGFRIQYFLTGEYRENHCTPLSRCLRLKSLLQRYLSLKTYPHA